MSLPSTGAISFDHIMKELGITGSFSLGSSQARSLSDVPSGPISLGSFRNKAYFVPGDYSKSVENYVAGIKSGVEPNVSLIPSSIDIVQLSKVTQATFSVVFEVKSQSVVNALPSVLTFSTKILDADTGAVLASNDLPTLIPSLPNQILGFGKNYTMSCSFSSATPRNIKFVCTGSSEQNRASNNVTVSSLRPFVHTASIFYTQRKF